MKMTQAKTFWAVKKEKKLHFNKQSAVLLANLTQNLLRKIIKTKYKRKIAIDLL